jgi:hypothetical protein
MGIQENNSVINKLIKERREKDNRKPKTISEEKKKENIKKWTSFYRRNINLYATRHLMIRLYPFQHIMLYLMSISEQFMAICGRGASKTFICGTYAVCKCNLFPHSEVHLTATTLSQAKKMVQDKIENELCKKLSPILKYYYDKDLIVFHYGKDEIYVDFLYNGSKLWIDVASDSSRGGRATLLFYEECRLLKKGIIDSVFEKMAHPRQAKFLTLPQYAGQERWIEECQSIYITSARYKNEWFWNTFKAIATETMMNKKTQYTFFAMDIFLSIAHGLKTKSDYFKAKKTSSELDFMMEDLNIMIGEAEDAFFTRDNFKKNQILKKAFIPPTTNEIANGVNNLNNRTKLPNEYRMLFIDYAFANTTGKEENDNSVIGCMSCIFENGKMRRLVDYMETPSASDITGMERRIRELFWDYQCDYIVLDLRNGGEISQVNLTKEWEHPERSEREWNKHGFTVCIENELHSVSSARLDDLKQKTVDPQAIPCIIPITATAESNSIMWLDLQKRLRNGDIEFLIDDLEYEQQLEETKEYFEMTIEEKARYKAPHIQTEYLIHEAVNLSQTWKDGKVKLSESRSGVKDRIVSLAYGNSVATLLEDKLCKQENTSSEFNIEDYYDIYS